MSHRKRLVIYYIYALLFICCNQHVSLCLITNDVSVLCQNFKTVIDTRSYRSVLHMGRYVAGCISPARITLIVPTRLPYGTTRDVHHTVTIAIRFRPEI